ncbi:hypothetical protein D9758_003516 [Tetrapyrgos nigripes]|uniref:Uncharacterized protein n=1 Tax=Tetrapyrgos nigripes TaxID=182062 RepID=A0A8H5GV31_9AGAR|nr:hypothetical protein D9758_003516 [Tetrapyrgos nigripes]
MTALQWLLKALRRLFYDKALRSSLRGIVLLWNFLKLQVKSARKSRRNGKVLKDGTVPGLEDDKLERAAQVAQKPPAEASVIVCASRVPDSVHLYPFSGPNASVSSQDIPTSSLNPEEGLPRPRTSSNSRISYPNISGHTRGSANASRVSIVGRGSRASSPASGTRISVYDPSTHASPVPSIRAPTPPPTVVIPNTQVPIPSHPSASHLSIDIPPANEDSFRITLRRPTGVLAGGEDGYDVALTTSPVQEGVTTAGNWPITEKRPMLKEIYENFFAMAPEIYFRYHEDGIVPKEIHEYKISPLTTCFQEPDPVGWKQCLHTEGARYFCYEEKKIYTDANILDERTRRHAMTLIQQFTDYCNEYQVQLSSSTNIVFDLFDQYIKGKTPENDYFKCRYYLVDHENRSVFWLDEFEATEFETWQSVKGVTELSHLRHEIEAQYWYHCHLFPDCIPLPTELVDELRGVLMHWIGDTLTSTTSTVPYPVGELQNMLSLASDFRKTTNPALCVSAYSRLMHIVARYRFTHFHGQTVVRLDRDRSVYLPPDFVPSQSWLMLSLSPWMFSTPDIYYNALNKIWIDGMMHEATWERFINGLKEQWQELILFGTVLLNANVAFLAIQSVDESTSLPQRSPAQIGSYLSVVATLGSIILGLFLARKHRVKPKESAADAANFLATWAMDENGDTNSTIGLETLAILYSVPYALLMWGVILFLVGFSAMCFESANVLVSSLIGCAWFVVTFFVTWCIFSLASWNQAGRKSFWEWVFGLVRHGMILLVLGVRMVLRRLSSGGCLSRGTSSPEEDEDGHSHSQNHSETNEKATVVQSPSDIHDHDQNRPYTPSHRRSPMEMETSALDSESQDDSDSRGRTSMRTLRRWKVSLFGQQRSSGDTGRTVV